MPAPPHNLPATPLLLGGHSHLAALEICVSLATCQPVHRSYRGAGLLRAKRGTKGTRCLACKAHWPKKIEKKLRSMLTARVNHTTHTGRVNSGGSESQGRGRSHGMGRENKDQGSADEFELLQQLQASSGRCLARIDFTSLLFCKNRSSIISHCFIHIFGGGRVLVGM